MATSSSMMSTRVPAPTVALWGETGISTIASGMRWLSQHGELKVECGSAADPAVDLDLAGVFLNDAIRDSEAESCPATLACGRSGLCGEERVVDAAHIFRRNA